MRGEHPTVWTSLETAQAQDGGAKAHQDLTEDPRWIDSHSQGPGMHCGTGLCEPSAGGTAIALTALGHGEPRHAPGPATNFLTATRHKAGTLPLRDIVRACLQVALAPQLEKMSHQVLFQALGSYGSNNVCPERQRGAVPETTQL